MKFKVRPEHLIIAGTLLTMTVCLFLFSPESAPEGMPEEYRGSSHSTWSTGTKGLYEVLDPKRREVRRLEGRLETVRHAKMLFIVAPSRHIGKDEEAALKRWIEEGGVLVYASRGSSTLFGVGVRNVGASIVASVDTEPLGRVPQGLRVWTSGGGRLASSDVKVAPLASDAQGTIVGMAPVGQGKIFFFADPDMLTHRGLGRFDNGVFVDLLASIYAGRGPVLFDEYHHGYQAGGSLFAALWGTAHGFGILQGLMALLFVALYAGRRFGPPVPLGKPVRREPLEFVDATAGIAQRAGATAFALKVLVDDIDLLVGRKHGIPAKDVGEFIRTRLLPGSPHGSAYVRAHSALRIGGIEPRMLLIYAQEIQVLRDIIEGETWS